MNDFKNFDRTLIEEARRVSPIDFIARAFPGAPIKIARNGNIKVKGFVRSERKNDGTWASFEWYGESLGDNISLVQKTMIGTKFYDAIEILTGKKPVFFNDFKKYKEPRYGNNDAVLNIKEINIPKFTTEYDKGREWLINRGISKQAIDIVEQQRGLKYTKDGIAYCGFNQFGSMKYVAIRYYEDREDELDGDIYNKKDVVGSHKRFVFMINPVEENKEYHAFIVEGGTNALALLDFCIDKNKNVFILTTGGVATREWMENDKILNMLGNAKDIVLINENESAGVRETAEQKQIRLDKVRYTIVKELNNKLIEKGYNTQAQYIKYVPVRYGDIADWRKAYITNENTRPKRMNDEENYVFHKQSMPEVQLELKRTRRSRLFYRKPTPKIELKEEQIKKNELNL